MRHLTALVTVCGLSIIAEAVQDQPVRSAGTISVGAAAIGGTGREVGTGRGVELTVHWEPRRLRWFSARASVSLSSFERATLTANMADIPVFSQYPEFNDWLVNTSLASVMIGPEIAVPRGPVRPYLNVQGGISQVGTGGQWLGTRRPARDSIPAFVGTPVPGYDYPLNDRDDNVALLAICSGVRVQVTSRLLIDAGVRRSYTSRATWRTESFATTDFFGAPPIPPHDFTRRLDATTFRIGVSYATR